MSRIQCWPFWKLFRVCYPSLCVFCFCLCVHFTSFSSLFLPQCREHFFSVHIATISLFINRPLHSSNSSQIVLSTLIRESVMHILWMENMLFEGIDDFCCVYGNGTSTYTAHTHTHISHLSSHAHCSATMEHGISRRFLVLSKQMIWAPCKRTQQKRISNHFHRAERERGGEEQTKNGCVVSCVMYEWYGVWCVVWCSVLLYNLLKRMYITLLTAYFQPKHFASH